MTSGILEICGGHHSAFSGKIDLDPNKSHFAFSSRGLGGCATMLPHPPLIITMSPDVLFLPLILGESLSIPKTGLISIPDFFFK